MTRLKQDAAGGFRARDQRGRDHSGPGGARGQRLSRPERAAMADRLDGSVTQFHSSAYRNPDSLPPGEVLVVGSGQSGCQIAEDLHLAGRKVHLAVGNAPRCPRVYRGRDVVEWLDDLGQYDLPVDQHGLKEKVRKNANHYLTGRDGGRDIDLRKFALEGMALYGRLQGRRRRAADLCRRSREKSRQCRPGLQRHLRPDRRPHRAQRASRRRPRRIMSRSGRRPARPHALDPAAGRHHLHRLDHRLPLRLVVGRPADFRRRAAIRPIGAA